MKTLLDIKSHLENLAQRKLSLDEGDIYSMCGGNYDDAYYNGSEDGETILARELLSLYFT